MLSEFMVTYKLTVFPASVTMAKLFTALILFSIFLLKTGDTHYLTNHDGRTCKSV